MAAVNLGGFEVDIVSIVVGVVVGYIIGYFSGKRAGMMGMGGFSDRKLKKDVVKIGTNGSLNVYTWVWNTRAEKLGLNGRGFGYMADEVEKVYPQHVHVKKGFKAIDYAALS